MQPDFFMRKIGISAAVLVLTCAAGWSQVGATVFQQGSTRLSLNVGYGSLNGNDYFIAGAGVGYYIYNGLEAGLDGDAWAGSKPHIYEVSPRLTYVFYQLDYPFKPYLGGLYRRTFYDTMKSVDSAGGRAGIISPIGEHTYLSAGLVFENYFHCDTHLYSSCSQVYPELGLAFSY